MMITEMRICTISGDRRIFRLDEPVEGKTAQDYAEEYQKVLNEGVGSIARDGKIIFVKHIESIDFI
jgi:hypothetical protein